MTGLPRAPAPRHVTHSSFGGRRIIPRPRVGNVLLAINLLVLALPFGGLLVLRVYESALIRQTESELIAQGAFVSAIYQSLLTEVRSDHGPAPAPANPLADYGLQLTGQGPGGLLPESDGGAWRPRSPQLDLANDPILPPSPEARAPGLPADVLAALAGSRLAPILKAAQVYTLAGIRVVDFKGVVVTSTGDGADLGRSLLARDEVARALRGEPVSLMRRRESSSGGFDWISRGANLRVIVATPMVKADRVLGAVVLTRTPATLWQAVKGKAGPLMKGALLLILIVAGLSLSLSRLISRPIQALIDQARRAAHGERGAITPLRQAGTREIAELSETVATLAQVLEQRALYIRDFAAHVSHEFKTPLTAMQGAMELLRDHGDGMSAEERERFLGIVETDMRRLERLVRRLLDLARADTQRPGEARADVGAAVDIVVARYRELGLALEIDRRAVDLELAMSPEILDSILGNLLDNARQHGGPDVKVGISISAEVDGAPVARIDVVDEGSGISPGNAGRIFEPFFTTAREQGGTGLGLAIVRSLLAAHGGTIQLLPGPGAGFRVQVPLAPRGIVPG